MPSRLEYHKCCTSIGKCFTDNISIRTVPYPISNAGADAFICYMDTVQLEAAAKNSLQLDSGNQFK
jgi:hypothetical protein